MRVGFTWVVVMVVALAGLAADATPRPPDLEKRVGFDQRLNHRIPLNLDFVDARGKAVRLSDYFHDLPVILVLGYYHCKNLCSSVMDGVIAGLKQVHFTPGKDFQVVNLSIDPNDTPQVALHKKRAYLKEYGSSADAPGWHFLTGKQQPIERLAKAVGFRYFYDRNIQQFVHAAGIVVLTPKGVLSRYFYGVQFPPTDLRLGLVEASANKIGSAIDQILLYCCRYDPSKGKYGFLVWRIMQVAGLFTVLILGSFLYVLSRYKVKQ